MHRSIYLSSSPLYVSFLIELRVIIHFTLYTNRPLAHLLRHPHLKTDVKRNPLYFDLLQATTRVNVDSLKPLVSLSLLHGKLNDFFLFSVFVVKRLMLLNDKNLNIPRPTLLVEF